MGKVVLIAAVLALSAAWAVPALGERTASRDTAQAAKANKRLHARVRRLERRVNALTRLVVRDRRDTGTDVRTATMSPLGHDFYQGTATCFGSDPTGGGIRFPNGGLRTDHVIDSYPVFGGWAAVASSAAGAPTVYVVCSP